MCGPHFCSMKITEDFRRYAAEKGIDDAAAIGRRLQEKAEEFRHAGQRFIPNRDEEHLTVSLAT
jgi:phosphomethylpyrimidine synthase